MKAERIRRLRKAAGYTQASLATALGVTTQTVANWEAGRSAPTAERDRKFRVLLERNLPSLQGRPSTESNLSEASILEWEYLERSAFITHWVADLISHLENWCPHWHPSEKGMINAEVKKERAKWIKVALQTCRRLSAELDAAFDRLPPDEAERIELFNPGLVNLDLVSELELFEKRNTHPTYYEELGKEARGSSLVPSNCGYSDEVLGRMYESVKTDSFPEQWFRATVED